MAGYIGSKTVNLSTTAANVGGDADIGGDLTVDTNTLYVDSTNNRVGVGTSSPANLLHLIGSSSTPSLRLGSTSLLYYWDIGRENATTGDFVFNQSINGTVSERMRIDSVGRVTTPSQPYFAVEINGNNNYVNISANVAAPFNTAVHNIGNHFNTSTYRFTAPITGKYLMTVGLIHTQADPTGRLMFYLNGNSDGGNMKWGINGSNSAGGGSHTATSIIYMSSGDYVDVRSQSGSLNHYQGNHSSWTGMLLG